MSLITLDDFKVPKACGECRFIGRYEEGLYIRNPHCCCEFIWQLKEEDYKVDKDSLDENCPLKMLNEHIHQRSNRSGIDLVALKKEFEDHINSITREELLESARRAEEMTAGCNDDWPDDLVQVVRCKDCKWRNTSGCIARWPVAVDDDGYCYGGEK